MTLKLSATGFVPRADAWLTTLPARFLSVVRGESNGTLVYHRPPLLVILQSLKAPVLVQASACILASLMIVAGGLARSRLG